LAPVNVHEKVLIKKEQLLVSSQFNFPAANQLFKSFTKIQNFIKLLDLFNFGIASYKAFWCNFLYVKKSHRLDL
jgi:hypothetical protein